jgi:hypothetical protein
MADTTEDNLADAELAMLSATNGASRVYKGISSAAESITRSSGYREEKVLQLRQQFNGVVAGVDKLHPQDEGGEAFDEVLARTVCRACSG